MLCVKENFTAMIKDKASYLSGRCPVSGYRDWGRWELQNNDVEGESSGSIFINVGPSKQEDLFLFYDYLFY